MAKKSVVFPKISGGIKKLTKCRSCGKRIVIKNFNQLLCEKCGYRESELKSKSEPSPCVA